MIKKFLLALLAVVLLAVGVLAYLVLTLDPEELGQTLIRRVNAAGGMQMQAESFQISPFRGLFLEDARVEGTLASGNLSADVSRVVIDYQLLPILKHEIVIDQIVIVEPRIVVVSSPAQQRSAGSGSGSGDRKRESSGAGTEDQYESGFEPTVTIAVFRIEDGSLISRTEGPVSNETTVSGIDLKLEDLRLDSSVADPLLGLSAAGSIEIEQISDGANVVSGTRGGIEVDRGLVAISDFGVDTENAALEISRLDLDLRQEPPRYSLALGGTYDLDSAVATEGSDSFGPASLQMSLEGRGPGLDQMTGAGVLRLESGSIPPFPMVSLIERLLGEQLITGTRYEATNIEFTLAETIVDLAPFVMALENMQIAGQGTVELSGPLDLQLGIKLPREQVHVKGIEGAIDGLTEDGWTTLPFDIDGTLGEPDVSIDSSIYKDAAVGMGKKAIGGLLDKVFDKDDSN